MALYGIIILLVGISLLGTVGALAAWLHRRFGLPHALLTVGILTFIGALMVRALALALIDRALLGILPIGALAFGVLAGFVDETARLLGFQFLARSTVTRPQALMIGLGHGSVGAIYTGVLAIGLGTSLLGAGAERPDDLGALLSGALAEALNGTLPLVMHMALSWIVLQVFLRGQIGWLFGAIFLHAAAEIMAALLGPADAWQVAAWRGLVALVSLLIILRLGPPAPDEPIPDSG